MPSMPVTLACTSALCSLCSMVGACGGGGVCVSGVRGGGVCVGNVCEGVFVMMVVMKVVVVLLGIRRSDADGDEMVVVAVFLLGERAPGLMLPPITFQFTLPPTTTHTTSTVSKVLDQQEPVVKELLQKEMEKLFAHKSAEELNQLFIEQHCNDNLPSLLAGEFLSHSMQCNDGYYYNRHSSHAA